MLRLSKLGDYAIVLMSSLSLRDRYTAPARVLAAETKIPWPTVVKLLKILAAGGAVRSVQGRNGGYSLARPPSQISLTEIIEVVEGPIAITECTGEASDCGIENSCQVRRHWLVINGVVRKALTGISLADLAPAEVSAQGLVEPPAMPLRKAV